MISFNKIVLCLTLFVGASAFGDGAPSSQSLHQAASGVFELTPAVGFASQKYNYGTASSNVSSATTSIFDLNLMGEYGVNEMISIGARIGYQKDNYSYNTKNSARSIPNQKGDGMVDPDIFINLRNDIGLGTLRYGANLAFSLGDVNLGDGNSLNEYSGGMTFTPYIGWEVPFGNHELGVRFSYDLVQTDRNYDFQGEKAKIKDGNEFTGTFFYEYNLAPVVVGADIGFMNYASSSANDFSGNESQNNSYTAGKIDVYAAYTVAKDFILLPQIGYNTLDTGAQYGRLGYEINGTSGSGGLYGEVALRMGF